MTVAGLLVKLMLMFPRGFGASEALESWEEIYREALGRFEGQVLEISYKAVMRGWTKSSPPKPGDFLLHCAGPDTGSDRPRESSTPGRFNMREISEKRTALISVLRRDWWLNNQELVDEFLASLDEADRWIARQKIAHRVDKQVDDVAMAQAQGRAAHIVLTDEDLEQIRATIPWTRDIDKDISMRGLPRKLPPITFTPAPEIPGPGEPPL